MTTSPAPGGRREKRTRQASIAVTICLFAWLALLPAHDGAAQERSRTPSPESLWKEYPLAPTAVPSGQPNPTSTPATSGRTNRRPVGAARPDTDGGAPVVVLVVLALITVGGTVTFVGIRRRRESEPRAAAVPLPPRAVEVGPVVPALWYGPSGRFSRAVMRTTAWATATVAATHERGDKGPGGGGDHARLRNGAPAPAAGAPSPATPVAAAAPEGLPPDPRLAWTAEIEWRQIEGDSRFCVIARGAGTVSVAQSPPLEWPPDGPAAVQAITDAAEELAATLAAAGWTALPPGRAWYAKRFAWEPVAAEPAQPVESAPSNSTVTARAKPVASPSPATPRPAPGGGGTTARVGSGRLGWKQIALLCVLLALGPIAALQFGGKRDGAPAVRSTPTPVTQAPGTPATEPTAAPTPKPKRKSSGGIDLSVPLLVLLGLLSLVLMIRQSRRVSR